MTRVLILGVGSPHGDDQAGWCVIDRLRKMIGAEQFDVNLEAISTPADVPALLIGGEELVLVDACQGSGSPGAIHRFDWPDDRVAPLCHRFGHALSLNQSLELAKALGRTPVRCAIWCVEGADFRPQASVSPIVADAVERLADTLFASLKPRSGLNA
jgi:hydrogenase maturation protease